MTANALRGEVSISLEGVEYVLRPTFEAITAIEDQTGQPLVDLAQAADQHALPVKQAAIVVTECIKAWGRETAQPQLTKFNAQRIGELIFAEGLLKAQPRVALVLWAALTGGHNPGEVGATGMKTETTTSDTPVAD